MENFSDLGKAVISPLFPVVGDPDPQAFADAFVPRPADDPNLVCDLLLGNFEDAKAYHEKWNALVEHHRLERIEHIRTTANDLHVVEEMKAFFQLGFEWDASIKPMGGYKEVEKTFEVDINIVLDRSEEPLRAAQLRLYMPLGWCSGKLVQKAHDPFYLSPEDPETFFRGSEGQKGLENVVKYIKAIKVGDKETLVSVTADDYTMREPSALYHDKDEWANMMAMFSAAGKGITFEPWHPPIISERSVAFEYNTTSFVGVEMYQPGMFVFDYGEDGKLTMARVNDQTYIPMKEVTINLIKGMIVKTAKKVVGSLWHHHGKK